MSTPADTMAPELGFFCVGLNHETSPLEVRVALVLSDEEVGRAIRALRERGASEALVISTCNRTEVYARAAELPNPPAFVAALLQEIKGLDLIGSGKSYLYTYRQPDSIRHLFRVACGLDSQILGEPQITGQVKGSLTLAAKLGGSGPVMERLLDAALRCAKRARTETGIGRGPVSSAYAAVNLAVKVLGSLEDKKVLLIGAGEVAGLAGCHFMEAGVGQFMIANRSRERAEKLGATMNARVISLEGIPVALPGADIVVSAGRRSRRARADGRNATRSGRTGRPSSISPCRDVDAHVAKLPNVRARWTRSALVAQASPTGAPRCPR
jgi:glutamyl-tRNA reductase